MTEFEFLMTLMSVLLAIGLAEILSGWGKVARSEERVRIYPLSLFWSVYLVVFAIAMWSRYWGFQVAEFSGMKILFLMMQTLIFVLVAYMLAPDPVPGRHYDMEAVYWRMARPVFLLIALMNMVVVPVVMMVADIDVAQRGELQWILSFAVGTSVMGLPPLLLAFVHKPWVHWVVSVVCLVFMVSEFLDYRLILES